VEISSDNSDFKVNLFPEFEPEKADNYISTAKIFLVESSKLVHASLKTGREGAFNDM
jgi:hypothetical protein